MSQPNDDEIREELQAHLDARAEWNQRRGLSPDEARRQASLAFGNATRIHEQTRAVNRTAWMDDLVRDLRYAVRSLSRERAVPLAAVLVLALGIGSATAVFSFVDRILFRSVPYPNPAGLVSFGLTAPLDRNEFMLHPDYVAWRSAQTPFAAMASTRGVSDCDLTEGDPARLKCAGVDQWMLPLLEITPIRGTNFTAEQDMPKGARAVILSYGVWVTRFGSSESIVGKTISLDGQATVVQGVLPAGFELPILQKFDLLVPQQTPTSPAARFPMMFLRGFARLKPGVTQQQAVLALQPLFQEALKTVPPGFRKEVSLRIQSIQDLQTGDYKTASWMLLGAVLAVFLIACANLSNLLMARTATRQREIAIRLSIGASRGRLVRQLLTESMLLALAGCAGGVAIGYGLIRAMVRLAPAGILRLDEASVDARILAFTIAIACVAALVAGILPALQLPTAQSLVSRSGGSSRPRLRLALVTMQIAASMVLLTGAVLLLRSLWNLEATPMGFQTTQIVAAEIALGRHGYETPASRSNFFNRLEAEVSAMPSASAVAISDFLPPSGRVASMIYSNIEVEGRAKHPESTGGMVPFRTVSPGFFSMLGIPVLKGRAFEAGDRSPGEDVVILNEILARRMFGQEDPLGKRIRFGQGNPWHMVVGVCGSIQNSGYAAREGEYYFVRKLTDDSRRAHLLIRTTSSADVVRPWLARQVAALDPSLPVTVSTLATRVEELAARPRFQALLLTWFAVLGLVLSVLGLYGVMRFLVTQRTREMGVRLALGATSGNVVGLILRQALEWCSAGVLLGLGAAWFAANLIEKLLYQVSPRDPVLWVIAVAALLAAALVAAWIPARRAGQIDPAVTLRADG